jgi:uncharacterized membrane protein YqaE (UPF0057 family)
VILDIIKIVLIFLLPFVAVQAIWYAWTKPGRRRDE